MWPHWEWLGLSLRCNLVASLLRFFSLRYITYVQSISRETKRERERQDNLLISPRCIYEMYLQSINANLYKSTMHYAWTTKRMLNISCASMLLCKFVWNDLTWNVRARWKSSSTFDDSARGLFCLLLQEELISVHISHLRNDLIASAEGKLN